VELKSIAAKTAKGVEEIQTRAYKLPQKKRSLLILVDGTRSVAELVARFPMFPDVLQVLQELADEGFVEAKVAAAPAPVSATAAPARSDAEEFSAAVRSLSRLLYDTIGPAADKVTAKLEAARDRDSFQRAWQSCALMAESTVGKKRTELLNERAAEIVSRFLQG
jgi:hypothetical protein